MENVERKMSADEASASEAQPLANQFCDEMIQNLRHNVGKQREAQREEEPQAFLRQICVNCESPWEQHADNTLLCPKGPRLTKFSPKDPSPPSRFEQLYEKDSNGMHVRRWKVGEEPDELKPSAVEMPEPLDSFVRYVYENCDEPLTHKDVDNAALQWAEAARKEGGE